jgi:hypothetical protein
MLVKLIFQTLNRLLVKIIIKLIGINAKVIRINKIQLILHSSLVEEGRLIQLKQL